jgi:O-antigen ligase
VSTVASARPQPRTFAEVAAWSWSTASAALLGFSSVALIAANNGGYFPTAWGWSALALLWAAALALLLRTQPAFGILECVAGGALVAFTSWIAIATTWSSDTSQSVLEIERALVYVAAVLAAAAIVRQRSISHFLGGLLVAITVVSAYSLATRLFPERLGRFDPIAGYRLSEPLGYWNALGIFAAMGALLALGFAARGRLSITRALAAASLVVLLPTLYFTFGRGPWLALAFALAAVIALDHRRVQLVTTLLVVSPAAAIAVWLGSRSPALTREQPALEEASRAGHRLAIAILGLAIVAALSAFVLSLAEKHLRIPRNVRLGYVAVLVGVLTALLAGVFVRYGSPPTIAQKAHDAFRGPPPRVEGDLSERLFSFSGSGRASYWNIAWENTEAHPVLGSGAGTFEQAWTQNRPAASTARDGHNLYLETLAELGPIGLGLLLIALGTPLVAAIRARRHPFVPAAFAAYVAYLVHAGVDWDWEMPAVTLAALFCGVAILLAARDEGRAWVLSLRVRAAAVAAVVALSGLALVGLVGNSALAASGEAASSEDYDTAEVEARKAIRWAPWSSQPWQALAEAHVGQGDFAAARESFRKAIAKDEQDWSLWLDLALVSEGAERERALARAAELNPLSPAIPAARKALEPDGVVLSEAEK